MKSNAWSRPRPKGTGPAYSSSYESVFNYDSAADALVVIRLYMTKEEPGLRRGVYAYDPEDERLGRPAAATGGGGEGHPQRQLRLL